MTRRPTAAVYRRRRLAVGLVALAVIGILWALGSWAFGAIKSSHDNAPAISSASDRASAEASTSPTTSVPVVPVGGKCNAGDIVVRPVRQAAYASEPVTLKFQVFTQRSPECIWKATHGSVQVKVSQHGNPFWSTAVCPTAVVEQTVTLRQGAPVTLALVRWNGHGASQASDCGAQGPWSWPANYIVEAAALGGNPSKDALTLVAPGEPLVQPTPSTAPGASTTVKPTATSKPTAKVTTKPTPSPTPSTTVWQ